VTIWLTVDQIAHINRHLFGSAVRDVGLLDSAAHAPQATIMGEDAFPTIHDKAARLLYGLASNHAFVDANKRTAWVATVVFYELNDHGLHIEDGEAVALVVQAAESLLTVAAISDILKTHAYFNDAAGQTG
jgi:death on curing protein